ncbi:hypothetical protein [Pedobacter sp. UBA4863]|uniref:hypothetical protein n=1 Tax=Pedobacter sp. UBA4863 TaxID=1947060 RepID=UPI0025DACBB7|nr:hypothetical protein [Pedobacter sp. UBA4863]
MVKQKYKTPNISKANVFACILLVLGVLFSSFKYAKNNDDKIKIAKEVKITFMVNVAENVVLPEGFADTLKKAADILTKILSSEDFKEALTKRSFADSAFSKTKKTCFERIYDENGRVSGLGVYENITRNPNIQIEWVIKKYKDGEKTSVMGFATFCVNKITSHDYWIKNGQYLSLRFVRHLAHEYTHVCGYKHDKLLPKEHKFKKGDDPASGVGGIVGDIMLDWTKRGLI